MGSNPIGALYRHCFFTLFFSSRILRNVERKNFRCNVNIFLKGRLCICHLFIIQNKRRGNFVQRETNLAQGREEDRPWCRLTQALVVQKLDTYAQWIP